MDYIIVQAGGKGSRLKYLTTNKPKALVPIENLPMIFYLFRKYPDKRFIIIADYHKEVLRKYLAAFAKVKHIVVDADGEGTCGGVKQAIEHIPQGEPFMLVWSDLILPEKFSLPEDYQNGKKPVDDYLGISGDFPCRWKYENGEFAEERSEEHGVAGFFLFHDKSVVEDVPTSGELVRWMRDSNLHFSEINLRGTKEYGLIEEYEKLLQPKCRPFNKITASDNVLTKEPVDEQGRKLSKRECAWYEKAKELNIGILPQIYSLNPLKMEYIDGKNIYECNFGYKEKKEILTKLISELKKLHSSDGMATDSFSLKEAYYNKTIARLSNIQDLVPFALERYITVNGKKCRNVFFYKDTLEKALEKLKCEKFEFIHGDCTFSNMMIRNDGSPVLIDPRGYFGFTELYGDARYDWAKIYYSIVGNYDTFNLKKFRLHIEDDGVSLQIDSNHWEDMEEDFFNLTGCDQYEIRLLHAVIWLSLTTYAWQDYDSICGAFYNGLWYLEDVL